MIKLIKDIINRLYGFLFDRRMLDQFIPLQVIRRTQEEYKLNHYGKHEFFIPTESQIQNLIQLPRFSLALTPQSLPRPYYFHLPGAGIYRDEIIDPENPNRVFLENFPDVSNPFEKENYPIRPWNKFQIKRRMKNKTYNAENAFFFAGRWWGNYYHFVIDYCIRYNSLKDNGLIDQDTTLLFPGRIKSWQKEYFSLLDINTHNILITNEKPLFIQKCLIAPTRRNRFLVSQSACKDFANKMVNAAGQDTVVSSAKRIYISRRNGSRRVLNEDELVQMLEAHNFRVVLCETLTVSEQIRLFSQAEVIVAAHGAGLTNLIYARKPKVIELIPNDAWIWGYFAMLTTHLGGDYHAIAGEQTNKKMDYKIDIEALNSLIECQLT